MDTSRLVEELEHRIDQGTTEQKEQQKEKGKRTQGTPTARRRDKRNGDGQTRGAGKNEGYRRMHGVNKLDEETLSGRKTWKFRRRWGLGVNVTGVEKMVVNSCL